MQEKIDTCFWYKGLLWSYVVRTVHIPLGRVPSDTVIIVVPYGPSCYMTPHGGLSPRAIPRFDGLYGHSFCLAIQRTASC